MQFGQIFVKNDRILVRFSGKSGQIVSQILENFSQILLISTLSMKGIIQFCFSNSFSFYSVYLYQFLIQIQGDHGVIGAPWGKLPISYYIEVALRNLLNICHMRRMIKDVLSCCLLQSLCYLSTRLPIEDCFISFSSLLCTSRAKGLQIQILCSSNF